MALQTLSSRFQSNPTTPQPREFEVTYKKRVETTRNGNSFLECNTSSGVVAFWGDRRSTANIHAIGAKKAPFKVRCACIDPKPPFDQQHALWVPQHGTIEFL